MERAWRHRSRTSSAPTSGGAGRRSASWRCAGPPRSRRTSARRTSPRTPSSRGPPRAIDVVLESRAVLIAGADALGSKGQEIREFASAIGSVVEAESRRYLMANVPTAKLEEVRAFLPGLSGPTIMNLIGRDDMVAMHVVVTEDAVNGIISLLKEAGATGILVMPIERMVVC